MYFMGPPGQMPPEVCHRSRTRFEVSPRWPNPRLVAELGRFTLSHLSIPICAEPLIYHHGGNAVRWLIARTAKIRYVQPKWMRELFNWCTYTPGPPWVMPFTHVSMREAAQRYYAAAKAGKIPYVRPSTGSQDDILNAWTVHISTATSRTSWRCHRRLVSRRSGCCRSRRSPPCC